MLNVLEQFGVKNSLVADYARWTNGFKDRILFDSEADSCEKKRCFVFCCMLKCYLDVQLFFKYDN